MSDEPAAFDASDDPDDDEMMAECLAACLEDPDVFLSALADVAEAKGMAQVAKASGLGRKSLWKALARGTHPRHETIREVVAVVGMKISITPTAAE